MKTRSAKNKGRRLQVQVRDALRSAFSKHLLPGDVETTTMGEMGVDIKLSPKGKEVIPYAIEVKNQERLNIWSAIEQAESNAGDAKPVVVFSRNRSKLYAVIEFEEFIKLIKNDKDNR